MDKVKIVLIGADRYAANYVRALLKELDKKDFEFVAAVDPAMEKIRTYGDLNAAGIPLYPSAEEFFKVGKADLAVISVPISLHKPITKLCLDNGTHVFCEKPFVPTLGELDEMEAYAEAKGLYVGVAFQLCYYQAIRKLKADIKSGKLGKLQTFRTYASWPRAWDYYSKWTGKLFANDGSFMLDAIAFNATAHYLNNMLFLLGDEPDTSAEPVSLKGELYRANKIESYDTCAAKIKLATGDELLFIASHATEKNEGPIFILKFEKATVHFDFEGQSFVDVIVKYNDGQLENYGKVTAGRACDDKLREMIMAVKTGDTSRISAKIKTVRPHAKVCNALLDYFDIIDFPREMVVEDAENQRTYARGLYQDLKAAYSEGKLPSEAGYAWAKATEWVDIKDYTQFGGAKIKR